MGRNYFLTTTYLVNYINSAVLTNSNDSSDTIDVTQYITFSDNSSYGSLLYYDDVLQPYYDSKEYVMTIEVEYSNIVPVFTFGTRLELEPGISPHNSYSVSLGLDNIVNRELSFAQGKGNSIDNRYSVALGVGNTIEQWVVGNGRDYSFAVGKDNNVYGGENVAIGINNTVYSDNGFAFGMQNQATANSFAIGRRNNANRNSLGDISRCSVAIGDGATSSGDGSVALNNATAEGINSIACNRSYACGINSCTLGKYNVADSNNLYAVIVGNGSSSSRSNALTLDWSGNLNVAGNVNGVDIANLNTTSTTTPTFASGWEAYDTAQAPHIRKCGQIVALTGAVKPTAAVTPGQDGVNIMTLPEEYRPQQRTLQICQGSGARKWLLDVRINGEVRCARYGTTAVTDQLAAGTWLPFHVTWILD